MSVESITPRQLRTKEQGDSPFASRDRYHHLKVRKARASDDLYRGWSAVDYDTRASLRFRVHIDPDLIAPADSKPHIDEETVTLLRSRAGKVVKSVSGEASAHWDMTRFLQRNWPRLREAFYTESTDASQIPPYSFVDVDLNGTTIDFIGVGIDGRIFMVDGSSNRKRKNIEEAVEKFKALAPLGADEPTAFLASCIDESRASALKQMRLNLYRAS